MSCPDLTNRKLLVLVRFLKFPWSCYFPQEGGHHFPTDKAGMNPDQMRSQLWILSHKSSPLLLWGRINTPGITMESPAGFSP